MRSLALRAASVHLRPAVVLALILTALPVRLVHSLLAVRMARPERSLPAVRMALLERSLPAVRMARPERSLPAVQTLARVRLLVPVADSSGLPLQAQSMRLVVGLRRRSARLGSLNLALHRLR